MPIQSQGKIIIISGPSGSGKTTLHKKLLLSEKLKGKIAKSISATTRPRRSDEQDGRDYLFLTVEEFLVDIESGYFLEWQKVFENYYGTPKNKVQVLLNAGQNVLLCIDVKGAGVIQKEFPDTVKIFIKVPSMEVLKERLALRGTESERDLKIRLETAEMELQQAKNYDYILTNDNLDQTYLKLEECVLKAIEDKSNEKESD